MATCSECGENVSMPYTCQRCNEQHCSKHRLPEKHSCPGLHRGGANPNVVLENIRAEENTGVRSSLPSTPSIIPNDIRKQAEGNMAMAFLGVIGVVYVLQWIVSLAVGPQAHDSLFVLRADNIEYLWTWITSIFAHSLDQPMHIIGNGIILLFFGTLLEKVIGTRKFVLLFLVSGTLAGLSQIGFGLLLSNPTVGVLGASGALMAILGVLTVYNPRLSVYLYFILPIPLWLITIGYVGFSMFGIFAGGGFGGIAHVAHLIGLVIGLAYGYYTKDAVSAPKQLSFGQGTHQRR